MRQRIEILPTGLVNKIAAGEVVERPASVVKELLENSLDAGAQRIDVTVEDGGRTLIRVSDDGCGIPAEEALLAFAQHATSKIRTADDLFAIRTMGFRGEALASIAGVSHTTMVTRTADSQQGIRVEVMDSVATGGQGQRTGIPCAASVGTTIEVRDLFYSVPARRKFLRTDATEFSHIHEMVLRSALAHPGVAFSLTHNRRKVLELPVTADARMRAAEALGGGGDETRQLYDGLMDLELEDRGIRVWGFGGQPAMARPTARYQYVFLNGRYIRDRSLMHAMKEAYRGLIEPAAQPVAIIMLEMDPGAFDVNVHPQKTEVRFRDAGAAYRAVLAALRERLLASDLTPAVRTAGRVGEVVGGRWQADAPATGGSGPRESAPPSAGDTRQAIAEFFRQASPVQPRLALEVETRRGGAEEAPGRAVAGQSVEPEAQEAAGAKEEAGAGAERGASWEGTPGGGAGRYVQLHNTYIVAETQDGVVIIDQHALHERIIYEELFARATRGVLEGQRLLIPEVLAVNPRQAAALETVKGLLARLGIEVEDFDGSSVAVHSFPSLLSKVSPRDFLRDLLDRLMEYGGAGGTKLTAEELLHEVLDMASCKAAVKAGYPLSEEEIAALLARKEQVERSSNCPHGRPTTLRLTIGDLERQFKRK